MKRRFRFATSCPSPWTWALLLVAAGSLLVAATGPDESAVLARIGDEMITVERFRREMARRGGGLPGQYATVEQREALLQDVIAFEAQAAEARRAGYDTDPETLEILKRIVVARYRADHLDAALESVRVTDEEIARFYEQNRDEFARPERVQAAMIFIQVPQQATQERRAELAQLAEAALEEARALDPNLHHFGNVARKYSDDRASRYKGGVVGWLVPDRRDGYKWDARVLDAVFALEQPGAIGPIVQTDDGLYLVRLVDRQESRARPLEAVAGGLRNRLIKEKQERLAEAFLERILSSETITVDEALLEAIPPPSPPAERRTPPSLPKG